MELTKEHFDEQLNKFVDKEYLDKQLSPLINKEYLDKQLSQFIDKKYLDSKLENFITKQELDKQTQELKEFSMDQTEALARVIAETVSKPLENVITRVVALERKVFKKY